MTINVSSNNSQQAILEVGDIGKFDVTDDKIYDFSVTLNSIFKGISADITIQEISEESPELIAQKQEAEEEEATKASNLKTITLGIILVVLIVVVLVIVYFKFFRTGKPVSKSREKKEI